MKFLSTMSCISFLLLCCESIAKEKTATEQKFSALVKNVRHHIALIERGKKIDDEVSVTVKSKILSPPLRINLNDTCPKDDLEIEFLCEYMSIFLNNSKNNIHKALAYWLPEERKGKEALLSQNNLWQKSSDFYKKNSLVIQGIIYQKSTTTVLVGDPIPHGFTLKFVNDKPFLTDHPADDVELSIVQGSFIMKLNAPTALYNEKGKIAGTIEYKDGVKDGLKKTYIGNGTLAGTVEYKKDLPDGPAKFYHKNGKLSSVVEYKNGLKEGLMTNYYENGVISQTTEFKNGLVDGISKHYSRNGKLISKGEYIKGEVIRVTVFKDDGVTIKEEQLVFNGKILAANGSGPLKCIPDNCTIDELRSLSLKAIKEYGFDDPELNTGSCVKSYESLKKAAEYGSAQMAMRLGLCNVFGQKDFKANMEEAIKWFEHAAPNSYISSLYLGHLWAKGEFPNPLRVFMQKVPNIKTHKIDHNKAVFYLELAKKNRAPPSQIDSLLKEELLKINKGKSAN